MTINTKGAVVDGAVFTNLDEVEARLAAQSYISDRKLATVVFLATRLNKRILWTP